MERTISGSEFSANSAGKSVQPAHSFLESLPPFDLDSILEHEPARLAFRWFLHERLCEENLMFWIDAQKYRLLARREIEKQPLRVMAAAIKLWQQYLAKNAEHEVSLPSSVFSSIQQLLEALRCGIYTFAEAQDLVYNDMLHGSLPGFVSSGAYHRMLVGLALDLAPSFLQRENVLPFEAAMPHPLVRAVFRAWLLARASDSGPSSDLQTLDYLLEVNRLKQAPYSRGEQVARCTQVEGVIRALLPHIAPDYADTANTANKPLTVTVQMLFAAMPAISSRVKSELYPSFVQSPIHRQLVHTVQRLARLAATEPNPPGRSMAHIISQFDQLTSYGQEDGAPAPAHAPAPSPAAAPAAHAQQRWRCAFCRSENLARKNLCGNCGQHKS